MQLRVKLFTCLAKKKSGIQQQSVCFITVPDVATFSLQTCRKAKAKKCETPETQFNIVDKKGQA
jgi:hypothetical protein